MPNALAATKGLLLLSWSSVGYKEKLLQDETQKLLKRGLGFR